MYVIVYIIMYVIIFIVASQGPISLLVGAEGVALKSWQHFISG